MVSLPMSLVSQSEINRKSNCSADLTRAPSYLEGGYAIRLGAFGLIFSPFVVQALRTKVKPQSSHREHVLFKYGAKSKMNLIWQRLSKSQAVEWGHLHQD